MSLPTDPYPTHLPPAHTTDPAFDGDAQPSDDEAGTEDHLAFAPSEQQVRGRFGHQVEHVSPSGLDESPMLDRVSVRLLVELSTRALSLREISELDAGATVVLAEGAANEVIVRTENGPALGTGELVNLDGTLGVLIRRVYA